MRRRSTPSRDSRSSARTLPARHGPAAGPDHGERVWGSARNCVHPWPSAANLQPLLPRQFVLLVAAFARVAPAAPSARSRHLQPARPPCSSSPGRAAPSPSARRRSGDRRGPRGDLRDPEKRQVQVHAWYPAVDAASGSRAPYLRAGMQEARAFATLMRQPRLPSITSPA